MPKPTKGLYRVATSGKPGAEGKFKYFDSLEEVNAAYPDLTGVKVKRFKELDEAAGEDVDPAAPEEPEGSPV